MTARTKSGYRGHETHGADEGTPHERLMHQHTHGKRATGRPMSDQQVPETAPAAPEPAPQMAAPEAPPGASPEPAADDQDADYT